MGGKQDRNFWGSRYLPSYVVKNVCYGPVFWWVCTQGAGSAGTLEPDPRVGVIKKLRRADDEWKKVCHLSSVMGHVSSYCIRWRANWWLHPVAKLSVVTLRHYASVKMTTCPLFVIVSLLSRACKHTGLASSKDARRAPVRSSSTAQIHFVPSLHHALFNSWVWHLACPWTATEPVFSKATAAIFLDITMWASLVCRLVSVLALNTKQEVHELTYKILTVGTSLQNRGPILHHCKATKHEPQNFWNIFFNTCKFKWWRQKSVFFISSDYFLASLYLRGCQMIRWDSHGALAASLMNIPWLTQNYLQKNITSRRIIPAYSDERPGVHHSQRATDKD